ncbi:hypothetical protein V1264_001469 [Littorina saxatilis]|uniref:Uncharacterized protein n=1 Tax=Littorina saxatilis TaxID=31220 RepID=A0AAN9C222_9CAEN
MEMCTQVRWVWEVKPIAEESDVGWQSVTHSQVTVTIEDDSDPCSVVQTSTLSLQPALDSDSSSSWSYRCYVKKNNVSYSSLALIYQVDVVVGETEGINATAQNVNADNGGKAKNDLIKWLLVFGVGILVVILIGAVVFAVRTVVPKAEKITAEATRPIHKHTARSWSTSGATQGSSIAVPVYNKHPQHGFPDSEESSNSSVSSFSSGMHASGGVGSSHSSSHQIPRRTKKLRKKRKKEKKRRREDEDKSDFSIAESKDDNENESDGDNDSGSDDSDDEDTTIYDEEPKKKYRSHSLSHMFADGAM